MISPLHYITNERKHIYFEQYTQLGCYLSTYIAKQKLLRSTYNTELEVIKYGLEYKHSSTQTQSVSLSLADSCSSFGFQCTRIYKMEVKLNILSRFFISCKIYGTPNSNMIMSLLTKSRIKLQSVCPLSHFTAKSNYQPNFLNEFSTIPDKTLSTEITTTINFPHENNSFLYSMISDLC